jgi:hypothetical protein
MKRRSFIAAASAAAGCVALGIKAKANPSWGKAQTPMIWCKFSKTDSRWVKDPFVKVDLGLEAGVSYYILSTIRDRLSFNVNFDRSCMIKNIDTSHVNHIPLEAKEFDKGQFYVDILKIYKNHKMDFYEIHNHTPDGDKITTFSNLYVVARPKGLSETSKCTRYNMSSYMVVMCD